MNIPELHWAGKCPILIYNKTYLTEAVDQGLSSVFLLLFLVLNFDIQYISCNVAILSLK